jgi:hypothetical protein
MDVVRSGRPLTAPKVGLSTPTPEADRAGRPLRLSSGGQRYPAWRREVLGTRAADGSDVAQRSAGRLPRAANRSPQLATCGGGPANFWS